MDRSRDFRRHQMERAKGRAKRTLRTIGLEPTQSQVCRLAIDRKPCSCCMCRNSRWIEGATRQETNGPQTKDWERDA